MSKITGQSEGAERVSIIFIAVVLFLVVFGVFSVAKMSNAKTGDTPNNSGLILKDSKLSLYLVIDPGTGCHYLRGPSGSLHVRVTDKGMHICRGADIAPEAATALANSLPSTPIAIK